MKNIKFSRSFFIKILAALALCLLIANISISSYKDNEAEKRKERVSVDSVQTRFVNALNDLGIKNDWIEREAIKQKKSPGPDSMLIVTVPSDLPIAVILTELNKQFVKDSVVLKSVEKEIRGLTELRIYADNSLRLFAQFIYDKNTLRSTSKAAFLLSGLDGENQKVQQQTITIPEQLSFLLIPSKKNADLIKSFGQYNKDYAILLNDDIKDTDFRIDKKYSKSRITNSIKSIVANFKNAKLFVVDNNSELINPELFKFISDEFAKRSIKLVLLDKLRTISGSSDEEVTGSFITELNSVRPDQIDIFLITVSDFNSVFKSFQELRKKGFKYVSISEAKINE